jgi:hypothetical protein
MKNAPLLTILLTLLFMLTACTGNNASTNSFGSGGSSSNSFRTGSGANIPLTPDSKLALGTIKLEGSKQAVDQKIAENLLPLWQLLLQLKTSSSTAPQEVAAVVDQIHTTMTPDQLKTINSMPLTQADIFTIFQQQAQSDSGGTNGSGTSRFSGSNRGGNGGGGFVFAGGGPGGPGGGFGGGFRNNAGGASTSQATALTAEQAAQARQNAISSLVINQLIRLLETKLRN